MREKHQCTIHEIYCFIYLSKYVIWVCVCHIWFYDVYLFILCVSTCTSIPTFFSISRPSDSAQSCPDVLELATSLKEVQRLGFFITKRRPLQRQVVQSSRLSRLTKNASLGYHIAHLFLNVKECTLAKSKHPLIAGWIFNMALDQHWRIVHMSSWCLFTITEKSHLEPVVAANPSPVQGHKTGRTLHLR